MKNDTKLDDWRNQIDAFDDALMTLLAKRMAVVRKIGVYKKQNGLPALDQKRWHSLLAKLIAKAQANGLNPNLVKKIWNAIHKHSLTHETI